MILYCGIIFIGIIVGYLLQQVQLKWINRLLMVTILALLFFLGINVGANPQVINGLQTLGKEALILTIGGVLGSCIAAWALWHFLIQGKKEEL